MAPSSLCAPWAREGMSPRQAQGSPLPPPRPPGEEVSEYSSTSHPSNPGSRECARPTPDPVSPLPSQRPLQMEALGAGRESRPGHWQDMQADRGVNPHLCAYAQALPRCVPSAREDQPLGGHRTGGARPTDADPRAGVSVFLTAASPGRRSRKCCGRSVYVKARQWVSCVCRPEPQ